MKKLFVVMILSVVAFAGNAAGKYTINDTQVETLMENAIEVNLDLNAESIMSTTQSGDKNVWVAVALDFFLGGLGIHRVYLGTPPGIIAGYFFTCGGIFGILPLVDLIVLVINNEDISAYVNKKGLIMFN